MKKKIINQIKKDYIAVDKDYLIGAILGVFTVVIIVLIICLIMRV